MILLDTHIWVWFNVDSSRIPDSIRGLYGGNDVELAVSSITIWETVMLALKGRLGSGLSPSEIAREWIEASPITIVPVDADIVMYSRTLAFTHEDPADRFIAATAFHLNCPLATVDTRLKSLPWLKTI